MNYANLIRKTTSDEGTFGEITFMDRKLYTLELPWKNNEPSISCIPEGIYPVEWVLSNRWKRNVYQLKKTEPRIAIQIHPGNFAGDKSLGWDSDVEGCILIAHSIGELKNKSGKMQKAVLDSRSAVAVFEQTMNHDNFMLNIQSQF